MADLLHPAPSPRPDFHLCLDSADLDALRTCSVAHVRVLAGIGE